MRKVMTIVMVRSTVAVALMLAFSCARAQTQQKDPQQPGAGQTAQTPANDKKADRAADDQKPADTSAQQKPTEPAKSMTPEEARQAQLLADTQRLYRLTQELKTEVDKSNKDTLSIQVIKKADEVEKLARSLKERMRAQP